MKRYLCLILFIYVIIWPISSGVAVYAATVGNPLDIDIPPRSAVLRERVINNTLDEYEEAVKIKASFDAEFVFNKEFDTSPEVSNAEIKGQYYMAKLGVDIFNRIEPYIKFGMSDLEANWRQNNQYDVEVDADMSFSWGVGLKGIIYELEDMGLRLTGDAQYRITEPDVKDITRGGVIVSDPGSDCKIEEWQLSLILSKKFELPLKWQSIYIVPYTGITVSDSTVDIKFNDSSLPGYNFDLFDASNKSMLGLVFGCDIMPRLDSSFIYSFELRLLNETALTLGGAMKF